MKHTVTIHQLETILSTLSENAKMHFGHAIAYYPEDVYKIYDAKSVELKKAHAVLSNITDINYIEIGINGLDKEIDYLNVRAVELEQFYFASKQEDSGDIESAITAVKQQLWELKKQKRLLATAPFDIEIDDFISKILIESSLI